LPPVSEAFDDAVREHDARLAALGAEVWVGSEPTFTDRLSEAPEWLHQALGGDKLQRATALLAALHARSPGAAVLRTLGRQYPGEPLPRWSLGLYRRRDGAAVWRGPPDPAVASAPAARAPDVPAWADRLASALRRSGRHCVGVATSGDAQQRRLLLQLDPAATRPDEHDPRVWRASVHARPVPAAGLRDPLADEGWGLVVLGVDTSDEGMTARVELPQLPETDAFLQLLDALAASAWESEITTLVITGHPPPVDATVEWATITPDPAVIEINTAPDASAAGFLHRSRETYAAAAVLGLAPYRLYYNGLVADSGGGGQITLGGASPLGSPFLREPRLLPRLVRFFNRHPALSYLYAHEHVGPSGQSVRADERGVDALDELGLALDLLARSCDAPPETLWRSLAPFLADASGNGHRAEINVEKLWNPHLHGRGRSGLVEFRGLRMQHTPERATALVCLLRAVVAMLARDEPQAGLADWGRELHGRFALPFYLCRDLRAVLRSLDAAGLGLGEPLVTELLRDEHRALGSAPLPGCRLELSRAVEFWPLIGDAVSQERGTSRLVDASTVRLQLLLRADPGGPAVAGWELSAGGVRLALRPERDGGGDLGLFGLRYRSFVPWQGMHPTLGVQSPLRILLRHPELPEAYAVTLHEWRPDGGAYPGLPSDLDEAAQRRHDRITVEAANPRLPDFDREAPPEALTPWHLDLRRL
jgi:uncharacterized protein (DUF2126 family)